MNREILQQALLTIKCGSGHSNVYYDPMALCEALEAELAKPEQEPDLPPVFIGVDVTHEGTQVNAFYRRPNDVAEMFYSEFHLLAKPEQDHSFDRTASHMAGEYVDTAEQEPVAYCVYCEGKFNLNIFHVKEVAEFEKMRLELEYPSFKREVVPIYAAPPEVKHWQDIAEYRLKLMFDLAKRKEWVNLTSEELAQLTIDNLGHPTKLTAAIEAKLRSKNG